VIDSAEQQPPAHPPKIAGVFPLGAAGSDKNQLSPGPQDEEEFSHGDRERRQAVVHITGA